MDRVCRGKNRICGNEREEGLIFLVLIIPSFNADQCKRVTVEYKFFSAVVTDLKHSIGSNIFDSAIDFNQSFVSR
jgi:hypothetical protein